MSNWNQQFHTYRAKTQAFPSWVTKIPLVVAIIILLPALVLALIALIVGLILFFFLLLLSRIISSFTTSLPSPNKPTDADMRVNVRVVEHRE